MRTKETMTYEDHKISPQGISVPLSTQKVQTEMIQISDLSIGGIKTLSSCQKRVWQRSFPQFVPKIEYPYYITKRD